MSKFEYRITRFFFAIFKRFNFSESDFVNRFSLFAKENNILNSRLTNDAIDSGMYLQYIPDRYSLNFKKYREEAGGLSYKESQKWIKENFNNNSGDYSRFFFINLCIDYLQADNIKGNVAELGVYKGNSAYLLMDYAVRSKTTCYLFDTFEGFDEKDLTAKDSNVEKQQFKNTSIEAVQENIGTKNTVYVKGYFPDSLANIEAEISYSIVHIDCDLAKPFEAALAYFYPRLTKGGFLIMHDHSSLFWPGATSVIDAFFKDKPEFLIPIPDKSGSCAIRKI